jgi:hypothetical protein
MKRDDWRPRPGAGSPNLASSEQKLRCNHLDTSLQIGQLVAVGLG